MSNTTLKKVDSELKARMQTVDELLEEIQRNIDESNSYNESLGKAILKVRNKGEFDSHSSLTDRVSSIISTFNIKPTHSYRMYSEKFFNDDAQALNSDWKNVNHDIWAAWISEHLKSRSTKQGV